MRSSLFVRESGQTGDRAIIFLHGVGNTGQMWRDHQRALASFHCLAPDLPGHGRSASIPWASRADAAQRVADVIESLPGRRASLVGLSLGGAVALELLGRRPDLLDHVVVDGCAATPTRLAPVMKAGVALVSPFIHRPSVGRAVAKAVGVRDPADVANLLDQFGQVHPASFRRAFADAQDVRIIPALAAAECPTLLVAGETELANVRASNRLLATLMPHAESRYMPGAGHGWLGRFLAAHVEMVRSWICDDGLPDALRPESTSFAPRPAAWGRNAT